VTGALALTVPLVLHGSDSRMELAYFWSAILIVLLPVGVFITIAVLLWRGYRRRSEADGGGPPDTRPATRV
jgi:lipopolysaccharide export LptBFGC system permease protein LptF